MEELECFHLRWLWQMTGITQSFAGSPMDDEVNPPHQCRPSDRGGEKCFVIGWCPECMRSTSRWNPLKQMYMSQ